MNKQVYDDRGQLIGTFDGEYVYDGRGAMIFRIDHGEVYSNALPANLKGLFNGEVATGFDGKIMFSIQK